MTVQPTSHDVLVREVELLRAKLSEAEQALVAIRNGGVDAIVVEGPEGPQVFTLRGADHPYRILIEQMNEGAGTLSADGVVLYANRRLAELLDLPLEQLIGATFRSFVVPSDLTLFAGLLEQGRSDRSEGDIMVQSAHGSAIPLHLSVSRLPEDSVAAVCLVATDLTERKRREDALQAAHDRLEERVADRTEALTRANQELRASRAEAVGNMEDAQKARRAVEEVNRELREESARKKRTAKALQRSEERFRMLFEGTVLSLAAMSELRDPYTAGHQQRVAELACAIAERTGLEQTRIDDLRVAGLLHDIGKISVPAEILNKPTALTEVEWNIVKSHVDLSYEILKGIPFERPVAEMVQAHHERLDGTGYPQGLKEGEILLEARILAVADVVEAMASHRPYRAALGVDRALEEIREGRGVRYDARAVDACVGLFAEGFAFSKLL